MAKNSSAWCAWAMSPGPRIKVSIPRLLKYGPSVPKSTAPDYMPDNCSPSLTIFESLSVCIAGNPANTG